jgi:hypothetical protein
MVYKNIAGWLKYMTLLMWGVVVLWIAYTVVSVTIILIILYFNKSRNENIRQINESKENYNKIDAQIKHLRDPIEIQIPDSTYKDTLKK